MTVRALDAQHDFTFGKGHSNYLSGSDEIKQTVKTRILQWVNDCYYALDEGVNWNVFLENADSDSLANDIKRIITQTYGVGQLVDFEYSLVDRDFKATYYIIDIFSESWEDTVENVTP